ncbi:hypothetical protein ACGF5M_06005 [Gemmatimonadota bacterium]
MTEESVVYPIEPKQRFGPCDTITGVSGLALVALMFVPWFVWIATGISITLGGETNNPSSSMSTWQFFEWKAYIFVITALLAIVLALFRRSLPTGIGTKLSLVAALLGLALAGLTLWYIASPPLVDGHRPGITIMDVDSAPVVGAYLGVMATLGIAAGGLLTFKSIRDWG